jgi:long-chain acyl-CoA synthetase
LLPGHPVRGTFEAGLLPWAWRIAHDRVWSGARGERRALNTASLLVAAASDRPNHPAIVFEGHTFTYEVLERLTNRFANAIGALGVAQGDVLAIYLESCPELVVAYLGAMKAGVVPNVVNGFLRPEEVQQIVADSDAKLLVTDPGRHDSLFAIRDALGIDRCVVTGWNHDVAADCAFDRLLAGRAESFEPLDLPPGSLASLLYTSGTTGHPKGVMLTHLNILDNATKFSAIHFTPEDRLLIAAPLFHCWGLISGTLGTFAARSTAVLARRYRTERVLDLIEAERPTIMQGVPTMYNYMAKSPSFGDRDISSLKFILSAAAPMPMELLKVVTDEWKVGYSDSWGLTETSPVATTTHYTQMRPGSCGRVMGDTRLKVVSTDGAELPIGEAGELWASGTAIAAGYYHRPEATAEVFTSDGWFRTGDIARIDEEGYVYIVDRVKDMINVAGEKVYPREVEEVLLRHPAVVDAVAIGIPDPDRGEVVKAYVVRDPSIGCTASELIDSLCPVLASYKLPRTIEFIEAIPRSPSGKALRRLLR